MKSLLITKVFPPETGGSGRWFWEIYRRLPKDEYAIIAGDHPKAAAFDQSHDLQLHRLPLNFSDWGTFSWNGYQQYRNATKQIKSHVSTRELNCIHTGRILPEGWIARSLSRRKRIPYLCYVHGEELSYASQSRQFAYMMRKVVKDSQLLIANSSNTKQLLIEHWGIPEKKVVLLHPGVDTVRFQPADKDLEFRKTMNWVDKKVVLTVGRLQKRKGHDVAIRAIKKISEHHPNILYAIAGDGDERKPLENLVKELDIEEHVQFLDEVDDEKLIQCYQQCALFLLANRDIDGDIEGFGMVLVEAQSCGKPVIAGNSGGTRDTMNIPSTGLLVNCEAPDELGQAISRLLADEDLMNTMGIEARKWVVEKFDWKKLAQQAQEVFESTKN